MGNCGVKTQRAGTATNKKLHRSTPTCSPAFWLLVCTGVFPVVVVCVVAAAVSDDFDFPPDFPPDFPFGGILLGFV